MYSENTEYYKSGLSELIKLLSEKREDVAAIFAIDRAMLILEYLAEETNNEDLKAALAGPLCVPKREKISAKSDSSSDASSDSGEDEDSDQFEEKIAKILEKRPDDETLKPRLLRALNRWMDHSTKGFRSIVGHPGFSEIRLGLHERAIMDIERGVVLPETYQKGNGRQAEYFDGAIGRYRDRVSHESLVEEPREGDSPEREFEGGSGEKTSSKPKKPKAKGGQKSGK
jgi:hypothetical protein